MAVIRRNVIFSLTYNVVGIGLAMAGLVGPLLAAVLMPLSSLIVVASSCSASSGQESRSLRRFCQGFKSGK